MTVSTLTPGFGPVPQYPSPYNSFREEQQVRNPTLLSALHALANSNKEWGPIVADKFTHLLELQLGTRRRSLISSEDYSRATLIERLRKASPEVRAQFQDALAQVASATDLTQGDRAALAVFADVQAGLNAPVPSTPTPVPPTPPVIARAPQPTNSTSVPRDVPDPENPVRVQLPAAAPTPSREQVHNQAASNFDNRRQGALHRIISALTPRYGSERANALANDLLNVDDSTAPQRVAAALHLAPNERQNIADAISALPPGVSPQQQLQQSRLQALALELPSAPTAASAAQRPPNMPERVNTPVDNPSLASENGNRRDIIIPADHSTIIRQTPDGYRVQVYSSNRSTTPVLSIAVSETQLRDGSITFRPAGQGPVDIQIMAFAPRDGFSLYPRPRQTPFNFSVEQPAGSPPPRVQGRIRGDTITTVQRSQQQVTSLPAPAPVQTSRETVPASLETALRNDRFTSPIAPLHYTHAGTIGTLPGAPRFTPGRDPGLDGIMPA